MPNFTTYSVSIRGTGIGIQPGNRATITLWDGSTVVGSISCWDPGVTIPNDSAAKPLAMNVPITMLPAMVDLLRHEGPLQIAFNPNLGKVLLYTATAEPVGEDET